MLRTFSCQPFVGKCPTVLPSCGPTPTRRASECSLCADSPPQTAVGQCACINLFCDEHGGTCACGFTGCGLCLAHHPCPLDTWLPSPTLVEALDPALAWHNSTEMSVQGEHLSSEQEQDKEKKRLRAAPRRMSPRNKKKTYQRRTKLPGSDWQRR